MLSDLRLHQKAAILQTARYWHKNRHRSMEHKRDTRNRAAQIYHKGGKNIQWRKDNPFSKRG